MDGDLIYLGDIKGSVDEYDYAYAFWDTGAVVLYQGTTSAWAYATRLYQGDMAYADVPFGYQRPGSVDLEMGIAYVDVEVSTHTVLNQTYYLYNEDGTIGELIPEPGSFIYPLIMVELNGEYVRDISSADGLDPTQAIDYAIEPIPSGETVNLLLQATDFGGNGDYVSYDGVL